MGFLFILPVLALDLWIIFSSARWLKRVDTTPRWRKAGVILISLGAGVGIWFSAFLTIRPTAKTRIVGFPIPVTVLQNDNGKWTPTDVPDVVRWGALATNLLTGIALALIPVKVAILTRDLSSANAEAGITRKP